MIYQLPEAPPPPKLPPPPIKPPPEENPPDKNPPPPKPPLLPMKGVDAKINPTKKPTTARITSTGNPNEKNKPIMGRAIALTIPLSNLPNEPTIIIKINAIQKNVA